MIECRNCGEALSETFARVYGDNNDDIHRCIHCVGEGEGGRRILKHGGGAIKDMEEVQRRMHHGI